MVIDLSGLMYNLELVFWCFFGTGWRVASSLAEVFQHLEAGA